MRTFKNKKYKDMTQTKPAAEVNAEVKRSQCSTNVMFYFPFSVCREKNLQNVFRNIDAAQTVLLVAGN